MCICVVCVFRRVFVGPKPCWSSMPDGGVLSCTRACAAEALCCSPMALWELLLLTFSLRCWLTSSASLAEEGPAGPLDWLLSDKGPFHHSQEYTEFVERNRQGFSTRYKIYRLVVIEPRLSMVFDGTSCSLQVCFILGQKVSRSWSSYTIFKYFSHI